MRAITPAATAINTATFGHRRPIEWIVDLCASRGIGALDPWLRDLDGRSAAKLAARAGAAGVVFNSLCRSSGLTDIDPVDRRAALDDNRRALDTAAELGAASFIMVVGGIPGGERGLVEARRRALDGLAVLLEHARGVGVALALEPLHPATTADRSCLCTLDQALDWCARLDPGAAGGVGVVVDAYHVWWDPALEAAVDRACRERRVLAHHVSDWLVPTRDPVSDRGMMGDGVIDLVGLRRRLEDGGYAGWIEVEIFSAADWWLRPEEEILDTCIERLRTVC